MEMVLILGSSGLVGSALVSRLQKKYPNINLLTPSSKSLNLLNYGEVDKYFCSLKPSHVFLCAAKVGGIIANTSFPVDFFNINMQIGMNVLKAAHQNNVKKVLSLGSTCIYPGNCPQPMKEEHLLSSKLELSNEAYSLAKISILKLCEYYNKQHGTNFISAMPTNVFGPGDNYHPQNSHAVAAMIRKIHEAKINNNPTIEVWGDGKPIREFMYSEDLANGLIYLMENYNGEKGFVNIGTGKGETIENLYRLVMKIIGYNGELKFDTSKPNGTTLKVSDQTLINSLGWKSKISLEEGIRKTYEHLKQINFKWKER